jgi:hypothetical protein
MPSNPQAIDGQPRDAEITIFAVDAERVCGIQDQASFL